MIKAITSVPVVRKALTGTMLVASLLGGAASCSRPARTEKSNIDQISYEKNLSQMARTNPDETRYEAFGLYFGTILNQFYSDMTSVNYITNDIYPEDWDYKTEKYEEHQKKWQQAHNVYRNITGVAYNYQESTKAKYLRDLYENADGVPTANECSEYLDRRIAGLDISSEDYNKCLRKIEDFKKAQGKQDNQEFAEYLAYKQFLIDSINTRAILRDLGYLKEPKIKRHFEQKTYNPEYAGGVRPTP